MKISLTRPKEGPFVTQIAVDGHQCYRCRSHNGLSQSTDQEWYCKDCLSFGYVCEHSTLYAYERTVLPHQAVLEMPVRLSSVQEQASQFLIKHYLAKNHAILQAVCGAGKTEILFPLFFCALKQQHRVCLAIPRKEIVHELVFRIQKAFPQSIVKPLSGDYKMDEHAHILVSTIHQLIAFEAEFDLIVVDEADAFPYQGSSFLERLLMKSMKPNGVLMKMSATLSPTLQTQIRNQRIPYHFIPIRYHEQSLDIPKMVRIGNHSTILCPEIMEFFVHQRQRGRQTLLFCPTIAMTECMAYEIQKQGMQAQSITSKTGNKQSLLERFIAQELKILVCTSILERGVTFANIDVAVIHADHTVFDKDTLVQIAGRVGRSSLYPHGEISFFAQTKTKAMMDAIALIRKMNKMAGFKR